MGAGQIDSHDRSEFVRLYRASAVALSVLLAASKMSDTILFLALTRQWTASMVTMGDDVLYEADG